MDQLIAHVKKNADGSFAEPHLLSAHLNDTARLCSQFASLFGKGKLGEILGLVHDAGKASEAFQARIRLVTDYAIEAHLEGKTAQHVDHSTAGSQFLIEKYGPFAGTLLAYAIAGHHAGLPDGKNAEQSCLSRRLKKSIEDYSAFKRLSEIELPMQLLPTDFVPNKDKTQTSKLSPYAVQFLIRMLYATLTDADFLDTEAYMSPEEIEFRKGKPTIAEIGKYFDQFLESLHHKESTPINLKRGEILRWCREAADLAPGLFSLTVPTGGGKTISSMAFALDQARQHGLRRVVYVIPYTSIIVQNAEVFRSIFKSMGDDVVLEHHSNLDPQSETPFNRLAAQNWDAPIVVTTNVQFFESFYANRSSKCRKLHNVADSVIIFDEAQMLPPDLLEPCLAVIRELVDSYGCSAVLCTATQPTLGKSKNLKQGLDNVREIIPDPKTLYHEFRRVRVRKIDQPLSHQNLAEQLSQYSQALAIVNTRKEARLVWESLIPLTSREECFHLSTMMCPEHRSDTLDAIRQCLKANLPCRVVSTQLIEAGVDVDFPVVYRAIAGIDSIAQAAGRCNREGRLESGEVYVFRGETAPPPGHLRQSAESGERIIATHPDDPLTIEAVEAYFNDFFWKRSLGNGLDKKGIMQMCRANPDAIPFREIAKAFSIIDEPTRTIIVPYGMRGIQLIEELRDSFNGMVPGRLRKEAQRYGVQLREKLFDELYKAGVIEDLFRDGQYLVLTNGDIYDDGVGLKSDNPVFMAVESQII